MSYLRNMRIYENTYSVDLPKRDPKVCPKETIIHYSLVVYTIVGARRKKSRVGRESVHSENSKDSQNRLIQLGLSILGLVVYDIEVQ